MFFSTHPSYCYKLKFFSYSDPPMPGAGKDFQEGEKSDVEYRNQFLYARLNKNELVRGSEGEEKIKTDFASPIGELNYDCIILYIL